MSIGEGAPTFLYFIWKAAPRPMGMPSPMKANPPSCTAHDMCQGRDHFHHPMRVVLALKGGTCMTVRNLSNVLAN